MAGGFTLPAVTVIIVAFGFIWMLLNSFMSGCFEFVFALCGNQGVSQILYLIWTYAPLCVGICLVLYSVVQSMNLSSDYE